MKINKESCNKINRLKTMTKNKGSNSLSYNLTKKNTRPTLAKEEGSQRMKRRKKEG